METSKTHSFLLSENQVAIRIGVAPATLRKSRCTGQLLGIKAPIFLRIGRTIRYRSTDIESWLNSLNSKEVTLELGE